jgi:hypothetical protein
MTATPIPPQGRPRVQSHVPLDNYAALMSGPRFKLPAAAALSSSSSIKSILARVDARMEEQDKKMEFLMSLSC